MRVLEVVDDLTTSPASSMVPVLDVWYNRQRLHSHFDYRTPTEYEALPLKAALPRKSAGRLYQPSPRTRSRSP